MSHSLNENAEQGARVDGGKKPVALRCKAFGRRSDRSLYFLPRDKKSIVINANSWKDGISVKEVDAK